ncbi:MAG: hypothetical protein A3A44_01300 [Candidatus Sungbacteria bacterium RIFCSPLOWO2_01_FULL_60_25]|uniref:SHS2 domain-containing protein n=1 Tax=Candidatus Sungbacteria bacterium RIFCSPLOWO2_01_FULL_60_25 TaxID=1802281 RepID=A0A1G2LEH0_9BACT|nr:MAG: hypothetical protein A3A44_01300 [Candidatus Sungbacteria bacterium RIFCSPLOWO2_01_FULL_60_25]
MLRPPAFGLDISDLTVKFIRVVERRGAFALDGFGEIGVPPGVIVGGEIKREADLILLLQKGLRTEDGRRIRERFCVASLPEEKSFVRMIEIPKMRAEDVGNAVRWEVEGVIPLPQNEIYFDYEPMPSLAGADHRDVLLTAFPRILVDSYHRVLTAAGFLPIALELESQAITRAIVTEVLARTPAVIIDIGATRTSFIISAANSIVFTKSISVGGRDFEHAIAQALGVDAERARKIKIEAGLDRQAEGGKVFAALVPELTAIATELEQQFWFWRDHTATRHPGIGDINTVILCGGDANLVGMEAFFATAIRKEVVRGNPFAKLSFSPGAIPPIARNLSLKYTTAIGLGIRAAAG